ncbi:MAG: hypothetical protein IR164_03015 [Devosia sp.]|uniref:hypothetical protein n=1 Tax=Devosia sp. TaxID=1871048 RepID=UPI0019E9003F|nr:hypothetical protein [Devosia sp.]MBF0677897.1 hypothetical protein [Devosia sp.]
MHKDIQNALDARFLAICTPQMAYDWLAARPKPQLFRTRGGELFGGLFGGAFDPTAEAEHSLFLREDPFIDYALARFGQSARVAAMLHSRLSLEDRKVMRACHAAGGGPLKPLLETSPEVVQELAFWVCNTNIGDDGLEHLFQKTGPFEKVEDGEYRALVELAGSNARLAMPYKRDFMDGFDEHAYYRIFQLAWGMTATAPVTQEWARALYTLLYQTIPKVGGLDIDAAIERWRIDDKPEDVKKWHGMSNSWYLRSLLGRFKGDAGLVSHDMAIRSGAYTVFDPQSCLDWPDFARRDGIVFFNAALENEAIWRNFSDRIRLSKIAWNIDGNSSLDSPNAFKSRQRYWKSKHPKWFEGDPAA